MNILHAFYNDLEATHDSLDAFQAAWDGKRTGVKGFLEKYPTFKDKPGLWGTTLLYSVARNNHPDLVEYLVSTVQCSVNAQNQQHLEHAMRVEHITAPDFQRNPAAGSTALHAACFNGHLDIVKTLIKHGADYFIQNQAEETPIMNGQSHPKIRKYFEDILILGYSKNLTVMPKKPILEGENQLVEDCFWEYKRFPEDEWKQFSLVESEELQTSMIVIPGKNFNCEVHLKLRSTVYTVSLAQFLRTGKESDPERNLAWVRCRGSSILNFDCYALWQIMLIKHPSQSSSFPSLEIFSMTGTNDPSFKVQLNAWYNCDSKTNSQLDHAMNYRRKLIRLDFDCFGTEELEFNLATFSLTNTDGTIMGFIRWIPRLISKTARNKKQITFLDNFRSLKTIDVVPLTTEYRKQIFNPSSETSVTLKQDDNGDEDDDNGGVAYNTSTRDDDYDETATKNDKIIKPSASRNWCLNESIQHGDNSIRDDNDDHQPELKADDYFNETKANLGVSAPLSIVENVKPVGDPQATESMLAELKIENDKLKQALDNERARIDNQIRLNAERDSLHKKELAEALNKIERKHAMDKENKEKEMAEAIAEINKKRTIDEKQKKQELAAAKAELDRKKAIDERKKNEEMTAAMNEINRKHDEEVKQREAKLAETRMKHDNMKAEIDEMRQNEAKLQKIQKSIKTVEYNAVKAQIMHEYIMPQFDVILGYLKKHTKNVDNHFADILPRLTFQSEDAVYKIIIHGFPNHHSVFKGVLERISKLSNSTDSAKQFYEGRLKQNIRSITETLSQIRTKIQIWRRYVQVLKELLQEKANKYMKMFSDYIDKKAKALIEETITGGSTQPWIELKTETDDFNTQNRFIGEIEELKQQALEEFIKENISFQRLKVDKVPTEKSVSTVKRFIDKVKTNMKEKPEYRGHDLKQFSLIPALLEQIMIYYSSFTLQLPLFEVAQELLEKIDRNTVTTITTSTGSGKSTLLPALLIAEGYDRVIVTQPRRLPCTLISQRVNETMTLEGSSQSLNLAGWAVSGAESNPNAKILYLTDGLLKERLQYDENLITNYTKVEKSIVFFIDEVHERSVNIDFCLALLARLLIVQPELQSKMKLIISSATLDSSVPTLFRQIPQLKFAEFQMPAMGTLYTVTKVARPNENILDIVLELYKKRERYDQILCFVNSVAQVNECVRLLAEISRDTIMAYPLVQSQASNIQQTYIETGSVFFSTTVAETSLTFPSLKYVIDTGMVNVPLYDLYLKRTVLKEIRAAESTIKQRLGRLGRTKPGEYYSLYNFKVEDLRYPVPQICQSDLLNTEFSLRRSPLKQGLNYMKQFLADKPDQQAIDATIDELRKLGILEMAPSDELTPHGKCLAILPDFGSLSMSKSVLAALSDYNCGYDLIALSSILSVLNTSAIFKDLPLNLKSPDGDFMTLLNIMNEILLVKQSVQPHQFNLKRVCNQKGLTNIQHIIGQALRRYNSLEKSFNLSAEYRQSAQYKSGNWQPVARSLLAGYPENVFVSMKELYEKTHQFCRCTDTNDIAILDLQSTLIRDKTQAPVPFVLARDIRFSTAVRSTAVISFLGEINPDWIESPMQRVLQVNVSEENHLKNNNLFSNALNKFSLSTTMKLDQQTISLQGHSGQVLNAELHLRQQMVTELQFQLTNNCVPNTAAYDNMERNLEMIMKMPYIFNPMKWRWEAEKQVKITISSNTNTKTCDITVEGRDSDNQKVKQEFDSFLSWLRNCAVIRHPNAGVTPRLLRPQMRKDCLDIEERISHVTDSKRTKVDLHYGIRGPKATRETRMEVVSWIAVCKFSCKVEGGFVRDWIVGNDTARPADLIQNPEAWVTEEIRNNVKIACIHKDVVPADLDCHLPSHKYFDIDRFQDELHKFNIKCKVYRDNWRYVILLDEDAPTGPFTMDLIEPHVALTHDRIDLDVSNLSLEKDYTHELGMRVNITESPYLIELEDIVNNIKKKHFRVLRPKDSYVDERIEKMIHRGWTQLGEAFSVIPAPHIKHHAILVPLPRSSTLYDEILQDMSEICGITIKSIEEIKNSLLEDTYEAMKKMIAKGCPGFNPNERKLFHGTFGDGIKGITNDGFDDRHFSAIGNYG
ncbi:unnamed protein product [Rotaria magnacalcarata]